MGMPNFNQLSDVKFVDIAWINYNGSCRNCRLLTIWNLKCCFKIWISCICCF